MPALLVLREAGGTSPLSQISPAPKEPGGTSTLILILLAPIKAGYPVHNVRTTGL